MSAHHPGGWIERSVAQAQAIAKCKVGRRRRRVARSGSAERSARTATDDAAKAIARSSRGGLHNEERTDCCNAVVFGCNGLLGWRQCPIARTHTRRHAARSGEIVWTSSLHHYRRSPSGIAPRQPHSDSGTTRGCHPVGQSPRGGWDMGRALVSRPPTQIECAGGPQRTRGLCRDTGRR